MHHWRPAFPTGPLAGFWCFVDINYTWITCCLCCSPALPPARSASVFLVSVHLCPLCQKPGLCFPWSVRLLSPNLDTCLCDLTTPSLPFMASSLPPACSYSPCPLDLASRIFSEMEAELKDNPDSWYPILFSTSVVVMWGGESTMGRDVTSLWHSGLGGCMISTTQIPEQFGKSLTQ